MNTELLPGTLDTNPRPPNTVREGADVQITYTGDGTVEVSVDGGSPISIKLDADGKGTFKAPAGSTLLWISAPGSADVSIRVVGE